METINSFFELKSISNIIKQMHLFYSKDMMQMIVSGGDPSINKKIIVQSFREWYSNTATNGCKNSFIFIDVPDETEEYSINDEILSNCLLPTNHITINGKLLFKECTLQKFFSELDYKDTVKESIINTIGKFTTLTYSQKTSEEYSIYLQNSTHVLSDYLRWLAQSSNLIIAINHFDSLSIHQRSKFQHILYSIDAPFKIITLTTNNPNYDSFLIYDNFTNLELSNLSYSDVNLLGGKVLQSKGLEPFVIENLMKECYQTYLGDLDKTISFIRRYSRNSEISFLSNEEFTYNLIENMSKLQKEIVVLSSLFPKGIKITYLEKIIKFMTDKISIEEFQNSLKLLTKQEVVLKKDEQLVFNGDSSFQESLSTYIKSNISEDDSVIHSLSRLAENTLDDLKDNQTNEDDFFVLMNLSFELKPAELKKNVTLLTDFIRMLSEIGYYQRIVNIYDQLISEDHSIILYLSIKTIDIFLNAMQKTSNFEKGLSLSNLLHKENTSILHEARFKTQLYKYDEALRSLEPYKDLPNYFITYLNILQHQRKDELVQSETENFLLNNEIEDDIYHIILRNTAYIFPADKAIENLKKSIFYFDSYCKTFEQATCENNLGIIYLYNSNTEKARQYFQEALEHHKKLDSNEIYQVYLNLGITSLMEGNYLLAKQHLTSGIRRIPDTLKFDLIKFEVAMYILKYLDNQITLNEAKESLAEYYSMTNPDPWLKFYIAYNLTLLEYIDDDLLREKQINTLKEKYIGNPDFYGIYHKLKIGEHFIEFLLPPSPNWRY
ncbi:tetratricopeptide repeat protein [Enterococcus hulanensis]|uniref:tetratricopeptide repeat protein n=1 Tax=Enterococcus hulanensis TaxID=2559929 RepID=UPI001A9064B3|nr:tetratricopeptide repeat protein [Enterococcus hulanensis]MBO0457105.1 tetratricopeptide repeat protein [Enterococcus hulanensis]